MKLLLLLACLCSLCLESRLDMKAVRRLTRDALNWNQLELGVVETAVYLWRVDEVCISIQLSLKLYHMLWDTMDPNKLFRSTLKHWLRSHRLLDSYSRVKDLHRSDFNFIGLNLHFRFAKKLKSAVCGESAQEINKPKNWIVTVMWLLYLVQQCITLSTAQINTEVSAEVMWLQPHQTAAQRLRVLSPSCRKILLFQGKSAFHQTSLILHHHHHLPHQGCWEVYL